MIVSFFRDRSAAKYGPQVYPPADNYPPVGTYPQPGNYPQTGTSWATRPDAGNGQPGGYSSADRW